MEKTPLNENAPNENNPTYSPTRSRIERRKEDRRKINLGPPAGTTDRRKVDRRTVRERRNK
jgi:hypothetical protein